MDENLRRLSMAIESTGDSGTTCHMTKGMVMAVDIAGTPPTCSIQLSGDTTTTIAGVRFLDSYFPVIGDVVQIIKQSSTLLIIGQISAGVSHAYNGWVAPTLAANWATHAADPVMYRLCLDGGSKKIQLRGRATITSGTPSNIWTMPSGLRPLFQIAPILVARGFGGGSNVAQIDVLETGAINLVGGTVGVKASSGQTGVGGGSAVTSSPINNPDQANDSETSDVYWSANGADAGRAQTSGPTTVVNSGDTTHRHLFQHTHKLEHQHTGGAHQHPLDAVTYPDFVSFNGVEYFI